MRFELLCELGRGSTGIVYKAIDCETRDTVAIKELLPGATAPQHELLFARILKRMRELVRRRLYVMTTHADEEADADDFSVFDEKARS